VIGPMFGSLDRKTRLNGQKKLNGKTNGHSDPRPDGDPRPEIPLEPEEAPEVIRLELRYGMAAAEAPPHEDTVVHGVLHLGSISLIYGKPKSGKSFLATNLALAVANNEVGHWMDHKIKLHGPVLYVACEGHGGFWKRLRAVGGVPDEFVLAIGRPKLIHNPDLRGYCWVPHPQDVELAIAQVMLRYKEEPILVVIDTVFRSFGGGDVNKSADMNAYVAAAQKIADREIAVLLVHHANKGNNLPSGSIALMGAADTLIAVERDKPNDTRVWQIEEAKDGAETGPRLFRLEVVDDIPDAFGDTVSSCRVVDEGMMPALEQKPRNARAAKKEEQPREPRPPSLNRNQGLVLTEIEALLSQADVSALRPVTSDGEPVPTITREQLRDRLLEKGYISRDPDTGVIPASDRGWLRDQLAALHRKGACVVATDRISLESWTTNPL
jgi:AAA domain